MIQNTYQLFCDSCSYKRITDGTDIGDLQEIKTESIPRGAPLLNPYGKQRQNPIVGQPGDLYSGTITPQAMKQQKRFKCPKCGHVIKARKIQKTEHENDEKNNTDGRETGSAGQPL